MKKILLICMAILLTALVVVGQGKKNEFIINNGSEPQTLDPSQISGVPEHRIYMALFEGLVINDPKTALAAPGLAESWKITNNGTTITFKLRKSVWSDGTPVTAKTFVKSWLRTLAPETGAEYAYMITMVVKGAEDYNIGKAGPEAVAVKALDDYTLQVDLIGPMPYAVDMMAHYAYAVLPMHVIEKYGDAWIKPQNIVCNGPFKLEAWKPKEYLSVVKNPKYWDAKNVKLERIKFLPIDDNNTAYNMYKGGEIDWNTGVPLDMIDEARVRSDYQVNPQVATYYYIFNMTRKPFDDVRVRKAMAMVLDRKELVTKVTKGGQMPTYAMVPPMAGYTPATGNAFNVEMAKQLLAEAGYPDGKGFPKMVLLYNTSEGHKKIAEWAQEQWRKYLGIEIALVNQEWKTFLDTRQNSHDFDFCRAGWVGDYLDPNTFLDMFLESSGLNDGLYNNPKFDELVRKAATMPAGKTRMDVLRQAEEILVTQDQHVIPLYHYVNIDLIDLSKWDGWYPNPLGIHNWKFIRRK